MDPEHIPFSMVIVSSIATALVLTAYETLEDAYHRRKEFVNDHLHPAYASGELSERPTIFNAKRLARELVLKRLPPYYLRGENIEGSRTDPRTLRVGQYL